MGWRAPPLSSKRKKVEMKGRCRLGLPKAKCPKCGAEYVGWALSNPGHRKCAKCGADLVVIAEEKPKVSNH